MSQPPVAARVPAATPEGPAPGRLPPASGAYPATLERLLGGPGNREAAWAAFLEEFSFLLLHVARSVSTSRDEAMDAYAHLLDRLGEGDFRRLRSYAADPRSKFTTWLVVVARRICVDLHRARYGRARPASTDAPRGRRTLRRKLEDLLAAKIDLGSVADDASESAEARVVAAEVSGVLSEEVAALSPRDQLLLKLRFDDGLRASEIAGILRLPSQFLVYRRINAVLATLRRSLSERGVD